jgi:hypothetical protein
MKLKFWANFSRSLFHRKEQDSSARDDARPATMIVQQTVVAHEVCSPYSENVLLLAKFSNLLLIIFQGLTWLCSN